MDRRTDPCQYFCPYFCQQYLLLAQIEGSKEKGLGGGNVEGLALLGYYRLKGLHVPLLTDRVLLVDGRAECF